MTVNDKAFIAEKRALEKYGGAQHVYFTDVIPDIVRVNAKNRLELIEAKYIDIEFDAWTRITSCIYRAEKQIKKRFECFPLGTEQRIFVLLTGNNTYGICATSVEYAIRNVMDKITRYKYPRVYVDVEMESEEVSDHG